MAIVVPIVADTSGLVRNLTKGSNGLSKFGKVAAVAAGAAGIGALVATVRVGIGEFVEQEKVIAQTNAVLKSTKSAANVTAKEIGNLSTAIMKKTGIDDEAIQSGQNLLLTFTKVRNEAGKGNDVFNQATVLMTDLSVAMGKDMTSSAMLVGKALNDPIKGVSALSRAGVQFTKDQKASIEAMVESGNVMGAQKMILKELETQFGGSAKAAGQTLSGQLNILKQTFNNLAGDLVARFMPNVTRAAQALVNFIQRFADAPTLKAKVEVITGAVGGVWERIKNWWNTGERKELPSGIKLTPPGKSQVNEFLSNLAASMNAEIDRTGRALGRSLVRGIFGGAKSQAAATGESTGGSIVRALVFNEAAFKVGKRIVTAIFSGIREELGNTDFSAFTTWLNGLANFLSPVGTQVGKRVWNAIEDGARPRRGGAQSRLANVITTAVRDAVQAARGSLMASGSTLSDMLAQIVDRKRLSPGGLSGGDILKQSREIEDRRLDLQEKQLKAALDEAEDKTEAQLALDEFYLQKEALLRQRSVDDDVKSNGEKIANLTERFNQGLIDARTFETELRGIIGGETGAELGFAFASAFDRELRTIINTVNDIFSTVGTGVPIAPGSSNVASTQTAENQRRFDEALEGWKKRREERREQAVNFRKRPGSAGGAKLTDAEQKEITEIMAAWDRNNPKPKKADYGLALGGILKKTVFSAGEAGPEAVMPLSGRGGVMLRDALGMNERRGSTYNITVNAGMGASGTDLGREIVEAIKKYERTNGNVFASA